ncbi:MAG TPA: CPBP family glutamic-type intramembrane protease, partial [Rhizomicrobium sp.]|nr:CPBP family glutamic-type intramembrane protease [Rhizomicrobium sp.]
MAEQITQVSVPRDERIRWWDLLVAFFGGNLLGVVLAFLAGIAAVLIAMLYGFHPTAGNLSRTFRENFWANQVAIVLSDLGFLAGIWLVARRRIERPTGRYFTPVSLRNMVLAAASGILLSILLNGGNELLERAFHLAFKETDIERVLEPHSPAQLVVALGAIALFAPFVEEYFFRGLFFDWVKRWGGSWIATAITAAAFAIAHGHFYVHPGAQGWIYTAELFVAGIVLAQWVARSG